MPQDPLTQPLNQSRAGTEPRTSVGSVSSPAAPSQSSTPEFSREPESKSRAFPPRGQDSNDAHASLQQVAGDSGEVRDKPAIRTMQSDIQDLLKSGRSPTPAQMIASQPGPEKAFASMRPHSPKHTLRTVILFAVLLVTAGIGGYLYLYGTPRAVAPIIPIPGSPVNQPAPRLTAPSPFFATETSHTITVAAGEQTAFYSRIQDSAKEQERENTMKRILVKIKDRDGRERFSTPADFFGLWRIAPPQYFLQRVDPPVMSFIFYGPGAVRFGFAFKTHDADRTLADMIAWESDLLDAFKPMLLEEPFGPIAPEAALFEDRTYRNVDWRYWKLSAQKDLGIGYGIFPGKQLFVVATSKQMMETVINRLYDSR